MKKTLYILVFFLIGLGTTGYGQQIAQSTFTEEGKHFWNPANTCSDRYLKSSLFFRQQWLGFGGSAPRTGFLSFQYPFSDMNMSAGAIVNFDQTGPVSKKGIQLLYAYQLNGLLGEKSQFSIGINAGFQQYVFDPASQIFNDINDDLLQGNSSSSFYPAISGGISFLSSTKQYAENVFFAGFSIRDAFTTDVLINGHNLSRERHLYLNIGTRIYQDYSYLEPSITVNYTNPEVLDLRIGLRYELEDTFWGGLGYSAVGEASIQGGVILPQFFNRYGTLRIGATGSFFTSSDIISFGPGIDFFVGYAYDIN